MTTPAPFDIPILRRRFERAATSYTDAAVIQREAGNRLLERFDWLKITPSTLLDVGCGPGTHSQALAARFPQARLLAIDHAPTMVKLAAPASRTWLPRLFGNRTRLQGVVADMTRLPLHSDSIDVMWSNFAAQWTHDLLALFVEWNRVLRVDGVLMFTLPGPDTLRELRAALQAAGEPADQRVHQFTDLHDIGDMLVQTGFSDPVMDMEILTLEYANAATLWRDLKAQAAQNALLHRPRGLLTPRRLHAIETQLQAKNSHVAKPIRMSIEVIYGHAWKLAPKKTVEGHGIVRVEDIRHQHR